MKRFLIKCAAFFLIIALLFVPFSVILDPYNVFHATKLVDNGVEPNKNYIKPLNVMRNMDKYDSLLFGSSRVGFFDVERMNDGVYYDMMASEAVPAEHVAILQSLIKRGFVPKNVIVGVDDISYFVDPSLHDNVLFRKMYPWDGSYIDKLGFFVRYLDPITNIESIETMRENEINDPEWGARLLSTGTENLSIVPGFDPKNLKPYWSDYYMPRPESLDDIRQLKQICDENGIKLRVFTNPIFGHTYMQDIENGYLDFLYELAQVTDYYNFSGFNDVTLNTANYYENSHYSAAVSNYIIDVIYYGETDDNLLSQGLGMYVTMDNRDQLMDILRSQAVNFDIEIDTYKDTLNKDKYDEEPTQ